MAVKPLASSSPLAVKPSRWGAGDSTANSAAATTAARRPASAQAAAPTPAVAIAAAAMARSRTVGSQPVAATSRYAATRPCGRSTQATGP